MGLKTFTTTANENDRIWTWLWAGYPQQLTQSNEASKSTLKEFFTDIL